MRVLRAWRVCSAGLLTIWLLGATLAGQTGPSAPAGQKPLMSEQAFKDVRLLRGIPVKEFMETMGFFSAALALNCSDCHGEASGSSWGNYALDSPLKTTSRRMIQMMNGINKANFGGAPVITCYTCHRGSQRPKATPSLALQYSVPPDEDPDEIEPLAAGTGRVTVTAEQVLDRYIEAIGGAAAAARLTSYTAKGTYEGFDSDFEQRPVEVYAKAPDMRATVVHMRVGDNIITHDGREAWQAGPSDLTPVTLFPLLGASLDGARLDAQLAFPGQIKQVLTDWRTGFPPLTIDDLPVDVVEGRTPARGRVKLYFDRKTALLVRSVRYSRTVVGTVPITVVYSEYRDVPGVGVKLPYKWEVIWTNGRGTYNITSLQPNVTIDAARFGRPAPGQAAN
jgi:photosynthetic reaction center cytochrome c subunit